MQRLRERNEWKLFAVLPKADRALAGVWWVVLVLRGLLPALFAIAMGLLVAAVQQGSGLAAPLGFAGGRVRPAPGPHAAPPGGERESRGPHRGLAL